LYSQSTCACAHSTRLNPKPTFTSRSSLGYISMPSAFAVLRQCSKPSVFFQKGWLGGWARHVYTARRYSTSNGLPPLTVLLDMDECLIH
ncbi:unnamed protein product, partial [Heterosigma akashiwo]